ncbi:MAG: helix-turn-helix transcriptional regulator [Pseudacidovorax sp.]|nr:helix-turn-helix transcriptional regulator [Pseudacidovorax sp.]
MSAPPPSVPVQPAKLSPPAAPAAQVLRQAIARQVHEAARARLLLVRAPAGFGKTTAMRQMRDRFEAEGIATAWLTLDGADNDVPRFLQSLGAAVQALGIEPAPGSGLGDPIAALGHDALPFALFLDDFEVLQSPAVIGLVRQLLDGLPRQGQLVIGSRSLPDLGLGRLRARGQLLEIDAALLRFSAAEAEEFFRLRGEALPRDTLERLLAKTEGWAGALWLASLALQRHGAAGSDFVERFSGSDRAVADYLAEDVLAQQSEEVRDFLLRTSVLRVLDAQVCAAVAPRADCAALLAQLEAGHLFLAPLASDARSYRYHSLFADFLRGQLARERPGDVARLHLAASGWYEAQGRPVPAIDHAIEGGDHPHALALLARHAERFLEEGRMRLLDRWFAALPPEQLAGQPLLQMVATWAECFTRGPWQALQRLQASGCETSEDAAVRAAVNGLQPLLLAMMDHPEDAYPVGHANLRRLPTCRPFADSALANAMAYIVSVMGEQHEAHRLLDAARRSQAGSIFNRMYTEAMEGVLDLAEGRLRQAAARFRVALSATPRSASYNPTQGNAWAGVLHAGVLYESDDPAGAEHLLSVYLPLARDVGLPDHVIAAYRMRARIAFLQGDVDSAFQLLTELEYLGHDRQLPRVVASAKLEHARLLMLQGNRDAAADMLERADDAAVWDRVRRLNLPAHQVDDIAIGRWRWQLRFGDAEAVRQALAPAIAEADTLARRHRALKLRVLLALAQARAGAAAEAQAVLAVVLAETAREGFVRLLLDEGPALAPLLRALQADRARLDEAGPIYADHVARLAAAFGEAHEDEPAASDAPQAPLAEPLTRKEIRVLELLAAGYSNAAMAEKLFVSDSTVRTHLRNINLKLGARSRTQAVALARQAGVVR